MLRIMAGSDDRAKTVLRSAGLVIYLSANDDLKEIIKQADTEGMLSLEGSADDEDR